MNAKTAGLWLWLLLGVSAALALAWQIRHPPQPPRIAVAPAPELPAVAPLENVGLAPPAHYGEITVRPLFIAERRPEPPPPPEETPPSEKPPAGPEQKFMLFGVMIAPGAQAALLRLQEPNARTARVKLGDMIGEWRLDKISAAGVVLRKGEAIQDLPLTRPRRPSRPRPGRPDTAKPGQPTAPPANAPIVPGMPGGAQLNAPMPPGVVPPPQ